MKNNEVKAADLEGVMVATQTSSSQYRPSGCEQSNTSDGQVECTENSAFPPVMFLE